MPVQGPQWTEFLSCHVCFKVFDDNLHLPISLGCSHTVCKSCLLKLQQRKCPFDQSSITHDVEELPVNNALLQLVDNVVLDKNFDVSCLSDNAQYYVSATKCIEDLALMLKPLSFDAVLLTSDLEEDGSKKTSNSSQLNCILSRPMQRKLVTLINCQLLEEEGRARVMRAARSLGERTVTELILQHQNPQQLSANLWAAVRARGCQFLGPAMQEEVLSLILLALEDGSALSRKVLVLFVVQRLEPQYPHASKTAIGHVVQLLYRASCFKVTKRDEESSLMQLKEEFRTNEMLRREHDSQIVEIALEAGLRISPEQWSSLLYGDAHHKSHMQSIIDKLQTPQSFNQSVSELMIALERTGDPCNLQRLRPHLEFLASVDPSPEMPAPSWENLDAVMKAVKTVVTDLFDFLSNFSSKKHELLPLQNARYKTSMCRDLAQKGVCPRSTSCTFAHSQEEIDKYRLRNKKLGTRTVSTLTSAALTPKEKVELAEVNKTMDKKLNPTYTVDCPLSDQEHPVVDEPNKQHMTKSNDADLSSSVEVMTVHSTPSTKIQEKVSSMPIVEGHGMVTPTAKETCVGSDSSIVSISSMVSNSNTASKPSIVSNSNTASHPNMVSNSNMVINPPRGPPYEVMPPTGGYQPYCPPFVPAVPPPSYVPRYTAGTTYPVCPPEVAAYSSSPKYYNSEYVGYEQSSLPVPWYSAGNTHPVCQTEVVAYSCSPQNYNQENVGCEQPSLPIPADQLSQHQYYGTQTVPYDSAMLVPCSVQTGNQQRDLNQVKKTLSDLHSRRTEILAKIQQNTQFGCGKQTCDSPKYKPAYPTTSMPHHSIGSYASTYKVHQQPPLETRHRAFEREFVFINPQIEKPKHLSTSLQERSFIHDVPSPMNVYTSVSSRPGVLHSTYLITAVTDAVDVSKASSFEKSGCPSYLSSSALYVPWSVEEYSSSGVSESQTGPGATKVQSTNFPWLKVSHQEGGEVQTEIVKGNYQDLDSFIPFCPTVVSRFGPISRLARTAKFKMTEPVHVTADESFGKMIPVMSIELPKTSSAPAPSRYTTDEILANNIYPVIPGHFSSDDIILRKHTPTSEGQNTWKCCISQNCLPEEHKTVGSSSTDEQLAYELQAIELKLSLTFGDNIAPLVDPNKGDPKQIQEDRRHELTGVQSSSQPISQQGISDKCLGLSSNLEDRENQKHELQKQLEQIDQEFARQFLMEEIDAQLLGIIQPRNT